MRRARSGTTGGNAQREAILRTAAGLFDQYGYKGARLEAIGRECGITHAAIYFYFDSKVELLREVLEYVAERFEARLVEIVGGVERSPEQLEAIVKSHVEMLLEEPSASRVFLQESAHADEDTRKRVQRILKEYTKSVERVYQGGVARGELRAEESGAIANSILSMCNGVLQWYKAEGSLSRGEVAEVVWRLIEGGCVLDGNRSDGLGGN